MAQLRIFAIVAFLLGGLFAMPLIAEPLDDSASEGGVSHLLLANGEVLEGRVTRVADRYDVWQPGGEIHLKVAEVAAVCPTLAECLKHRRKLSGLESPDDPAAVFDWCIRHRLLDDAANELTAIRNLEPNHPRLHLLERKLELANALSTAPLAAKASVAQPSGEELDRMVRGMPTGAVETFTNTIQPLLMNYCATAGCHGQSSPSDFKLLRVSPKRTADRRTTQRNLHAALGLIDPTSPKKSLLLTMASQPHGDKSVAPLNRDSPHHQSLAAWVARFANIDGAAEIKDLRVEFVQSPPKRSRGKNKTGLGRVNLATRADSKDQPEVRQLGDAVDVASTRVGRTNSKYGARFKTGADEDLAQPADPFDPDAFNRRFSPQTTAKKDSLDEPRSLSIEAMRDSVPLDENLSPPADPPSTPTRRRGGSP